MPAPELSIMPVPERIAPKAPTVVLHDVDEAARWVRGLPTEANALHAALTAQLDALSASRLAPRERARIAEVLREPVMHLHTELARRYAGKPIPLGKRERHAADQAIAVWTGLWEQFSACLKPLLERDPELEGVKAKLLQRGLHIGKELVIVYGLARRVPPPSLWEEIHAYYRLAELVDCTGTAVSDGYVPDGLALSCYSMYSHALLLGLADLCSLSVRQIELTDRWLHMWARKVFPYPQQRDEESPVLLVDIASSAGAWLAAKAPEQPSDSMRFGYPAKLAQSVRGRLKRLQSGASPAELQLGQDCSVEQCTRLLSHLDARWYQLPRTHERAERSVLLCAGGLSAAYYRATGRTFERKEPRATSTYRNASFNTIAAVTGYDAGRDQAEQEWPWEEWMGACGQRDGRITRADASKHRFMLEQLAIVRDGNRIRFGWITRMAQGSEGRTDLALRLFAGRPQALSVSAVSTSLVKEAAVPAILLGEVPEDKACLLLPPRTFSPGRRLRAMDKGVERAYRVTRLLQRGADFERVAFEFDT
jgi:hypothetical protein